MMRSVFNRISIFWLVVSLFTGKILAEDFKPRGMPLLNLNFQFTLPLMLIPNTVYPGKGDWVPGTIAFPFGMGFDAGYIFQFHPDHSAQALFSLAYDDDPINYLFDKNLSSKDIIPSFTQQLLYGLANIKYSWRPAPFLKTGWALDGGGQLNRTSAAESFSNGLYNNYFFGGMIQGSLSQLDRLVPFLGNLEGELAIGLHYYWYPNYTVTLDPDQTKIYFSSASDIEIKKKQEEHANFRVDANVGQVFLERIRLNVHYGFNFDVYPKKNIIDLKGIDTTTNQFVITHHASLQGGLILFNEGKNAAPLDLGLGFELRLVEDNLLIRSSVENSLVGDLPNSVLSNGSPISTSQGSIPFKNHQSTTTFGMSPSVNWHLSKWVTLSGQYSLKSRFYLGKYATWGVGEKAGKTAGSFKDELQNDIFHVVTLGVHFHSASGYRDFFPFVGWQRKLSNNKGDPFGEYHLFSLGFKTVFEF